MRAPVHVSAREVAQWVEQKRGWIERQLQQVAALPEKYEPSYQWQTPVYWKGEAHLLLPDDMSLLPADQCYLQPGGLAADAPAVVERRTRQWLRERALVELQARHAYWCDLLAGWRLPASFVALRQMKRRWGSCRQDGRIVLNLDLIRYPMPCIDVVIVHELCHLKEFNHSPKFYRLLTEALPAWREFDQQLNECAQRY